MEPSAASGASLPLKVLSLDGGGIRGLSSLLILEHLMEQVRDAEGLGETPRPCERFDLIGGTSTGGIIAIMLGRLGMTVDECIRAYRKVAERAFTPKRTVGAMFPASPSGAFSATALEEAIRETIRDFCPSPACIARRVQGGATSETCKHGEMGFRDEQCTDTVVLAITKANVDTLPTLFKSYDTSTSLSGCTIWQVVRATSAATTFFKPIKVGRDRIEFIDAGFGYNNPCEVLVQEAQRRFPGRSRFQILSIGTGLGDVVSVTDSRRGIIGALKKMATTSKQVAARMDARYREGGGYFRFNVERGMEDTALSDWEKASEISAHTRNYLAENDKQVSRFIKEFLGGSRPEAGSGSVPLSRRNETITNTPRNSHYLIPFPENRWFVGRTEILNTLTAKLFGDDGSRLVAVDGLGGVGKTQVALRLAYWVKRHQPEFSVFWMPAQSHTSFEQACAELIKMVGVQGSETEDPRQLVQRYLSSDRCGKWFLIVDNADDMNMVRGTESTDQVKDDGICNYLPQTPNGRILFTSRSHSMAVAMARSEVVEISQMSHNEAVEFLEKSLVDKSAMGPESDQAGITELLGALTYLPLAIAQATAYMNTNQVSASEYVSLMKNTDEDLLELLATEFHDDTRYRGSHNAIASTWIVSFNQIQRDPDAAALLSFISHVEPKAIPRSMLPQAPSRKRAIDATGLLRGYSFLSVQNDGQTYDMHRLVHLASRVWVGRQPDAQERRRTAMAHLESALKAADLDSFASRKEARQYVPHVLAVLGLRKADKWQDWETSLGYWAGKFLNEMGTSESHAAVKLLERVAGAQQNLAKEDPDRLATQDALAQNQKGDRSV